MTLFSRHDLKKLIEEHAEPCISIYMPTQHIPSEKKQNKIRFKNLISTAEGHVSADLGIREARKILKPCRRLLDESPFWIEQKEGLAAFVSPEHFYFFRMPLVFDELVVVAPRFHIKPLLTLFSSDNRFYILALSKNEIRMLEASTFGARPVPLEGVPANLKESMQYEDIEKQIQFHTQAPAGRGKRPAIFHGHGPGAEDSKEYLIDYFRHINRGVSDLLRDERSPLVIACVDYLFPLYKKVNTYSHLVKTFIKGNPDGSHEAELFKKARSIIDPLFKREQEDAVARYGELKAHGLTSTDVKEIVPASYHGRVEVLFVAVGHQRWGVFDPEEGTVSIQRKQSTKNEDLLDLAAVQTILHGGVVYPLKKRRMMDDALIAALYRY